MAQPLVIDIRMTGAETGVRYECPNGHIRLTLTDEGSVMFEKTGPPPKCAKCQTLLTKTTI